MMEREGSERRSESLLKKFQDLFMHLSSTLGADLGQPSVTAFDTVVAKVRRSHRVCLVSCNLRFFHLDF